MGEDTSAIWSDDLLGRKGDSDFIQSFLKARIEERKSEGKKKSYVLNLDAGWGHGKTFFLNHLAEDLRLQKHLVAYVNAWADDFSADPLVSVMASVDAVVRPLLPRRGPAKVAFEAVQKNLGGILLAGAKGAAMQLARKGIGAGADEIKAILESTGDGPSSTVADVAEEAATEAVRELSDRYAKSALDDFNAAKRSAVSFKANLEAVLADLEKTKGIPLPLFVLVDELDRCRPPFAIAMLERIKHLFDADGVVFVVATDTEQLQHSIRAVYGSEFDAGRYLTRFFNRSYRFSPPAMLSFIEGIMKSSPLAAQKLAMFQGYTVNKYFADTFEYLGVGLRDAEVAYDIVRTVVTTWDAKVPVQLAVLLPLAVARISGVAVELSADLLEHIRSARRSKHDGTGIGYRHRYRDYTSSDMKEAVVTPKSLYNEYAAMARGRLDAVASNDRSGPAGFFAREQAREEFGKLYNNTFTQGRELRWSITAYPEVVERAGRLVDLDHPDDK